MNKLARTTALAAALLASACGAASPSPRDPASSSPSAGVSTHAGLNLKHTSIFVDDQARALAFYTDVLGFAKKDDFENSGFRWLTVSHPADPRGPELQLALDSDPAAKAFQEAMYKQAQPALMLYAKDVKAEAARIKAKGGTLTMEPTEVMPGSWIAQVDDGVGNLVQITQLD